MNPAKFILLATALNVVMFGALMIITLLQYLSVTEALLVFVVILIVGSYMTYFIVRN